MNSIAVPGVRETLAVRAAEVEHRVRSAYTNTRFPSGVALTATGGFGRGELFPYSDVDLLVVVESEHQIAPIKPALSEFLQTLWDGGLRPSHAIQTVNYCVTDHEDNLELTISLLDRRRIAGDPEMYRWLDQRFRAYLSKRGAAIADRLASHANARRAKFQDTVHHLEPNLKDGPGGLRDLQTIRWLAALNPRVPAPDLSAAFEFYAGLRVRMHESAGRDQNLLSFDVQESLSEHPAELMRDYLRHARAVDQAARRSMESAKPREGNLVERFHDWRSRISNTEFTVLRDRVWLRSPASLDRGLSLFEFVARHELRLAFDTIDRLSGRGPETVWEDWRALLSLPHAGMGLRAMQESGVLASAVPEWSHVDCLVVRDFYHHYTVDEHTLVAIDSLETIQDRRFADLWAEIDDPAIVRFALLMHDIGKGSGHDHVDESRRVAHRVLERLRTPENDRATVEFLVAHHLDLSTIMTSRDLSDEATAQMLAERVGTVERLKRLAIMTYADISAVNPNAMSPWRLEQLWRVYLLAHSELTKTLYTERIHDAPGERAGFLEGLPTRYLRTHLDSEIAGHVELAGQLESRAVAIEIVHERGVYRLTLLTRDHPGLFAAVAGAISSFGLSILKAEAFSNAHGIVVDTFTFSDPHRSLELNPPEVDRLRGIVRKVVEGKLDAAQLLRGRPKPLLPSRGARFEPRVQLNNFASETATLIEIVAEDRAGLLYDLTRAISSAGCNIEVVLIDTEAHRALDVFYVTVRGEKLDGELAKKLRATLLAACSAS
ncbi:MAG TPA: ACT domain-containing protein [Bryobacteraceae bacterium]|nr:ACT domain-containing protein [Bryobacteraceae bacterium]